MEQKIKARIVLAHADTNEQQIALPNEIILYDFKKSLTNNSENKEIRLRIGDGENQIVNLPDLPLGNMHYYDSKPTTPEVGDIWYNEAEKTFYLGTGNPIYEKIKITRQEYQPNIYYKWLADEERYVLDSSTDWVAGQTYYILKDSIKLSYVIEYIEEGLGEKSIQTTGGSQAYSNYSVALGEYNISGAKAFSLNQEYIYTDEDIAQKRYYLNSTENIVVGDKFSIVLKDNYDFLGKITGVSTTNTGNKYVTVDTYEIPNANVANQISINSYLLIPNKPTIGDKVIGTGAYTEGSSNKALGSNAHAEGYNTLAAGKYSHAEGKNTKAGYAGHAEGSGTTAKFSAHAEGGSTTAQGEYSHAEGLSTTANGHSSHAEGQDTISSETASHAEGYSTKANGKYTHAEGVSTIASEMAAHAEGNTTEASGKFSHAEGSATKANGENSHAEGTTTNASGINSHAEGNGTTASGNAAHTEGQGTIASGDQAHAEGYKSQASYQAAHAEGYVTTATKIGAHAEGSSTEATGDGAHAEGYDTIASGPYSHAEGSGTTAVSFVTHAEGQGTIARGNAQHVQGKYNIDDTNKKYAHIVGNGTSEQRSNAHTLDWDGNAWYAGDIEAKNIYGSSLSVKDNDNNNVAFIDNEGKGKFNSLVIKDGEKEYPVLNYIGAGEILPNAAKEGDIFRIPSKRIEIEKNTIIQCSNSMINGCIGGFKGKLYSSSFISPVSYGDESLNRCVLAFTDTNLYQLFQTYSSSAVVLDFKDKTLILTIIDTQHSREDLQILVEGILATELQEEYLEKYNNFYLYGVNELNGFELEASLKGTAPLNDNTLFNYIIKLIKNVYPINDELLLNTGGMYQLNPAVRFTCSWADYISYGEFVITAIGFDGETYYITYDEDFGPWGDFMDQNVYQVGSPQLTALNYIYNSETTYYIYSQDFGWESLGEGTNLLNPVMGNSNIPLIGYSEYCKYQVTEKDDLPSVLEKAVEDGNTLLYIEEGEYNGLTYILPYSNLQIIGLGRVVFNFKIYEPILKSLQQTQTYEFHNIVFNNIYEHQGLKNDNDNIVTAILNKVNFIQCEIRKPISVGSGKFINCFIYNSIDNVIRSDYTMASSYDNSNFYFNQNNIKSYTLWAKSISNCNFYIGKNVETIIIKDGFYSLPYIYNNNFYITTRNCQMQTTSLETVKITESNFLQYPFANIECIDEETCYINNNNNNSNNNNNNNYQGEIKSLTDTYLTTQILEGNIYKVTASNSAPTLEIIENQELGKKIKVENGYVYSGMSDSYEFTINNPSEDLIKTIQIALGVTNNSNFLNTTYYLKTESERCYLKIILGDYKTNFGYEQEGFLITSIKYDTTENKFYLWSKISDSGLMVEFEQNLKSCSIYLLSEKIKQYFTIESGFKYYKEYYPNSLFIWREDEWENLVEAKKEQQIVQYSTEDLDLTLNPTLPSGTLYIVYEE